jgi:molybdopterin molybdotransferase
MKTGQVIELSHLMALATLGFSRVCVARMPNIALISTGRELVDPSSPRLQPGQIRNSTGLYLKKYFESLHHPITECGTVSDDPEDYLKRLTQALDSGAEVVISTGAVSMGKFDFVKPALEKLGAKIHFHKCAIRPGKPILFASGNWRGKTVFFFGVPGNPVSTAVGLRFFVRPFLDHMLGIQTGDGSVADGIALRSARLINDFKKPEGLRCFFKAIERVSPNGETLVEALPGQASFMVSPLLKANSWVVFPESGSSAKAGSMVEVCHL